MAISTRSTANACGGRTCATTTATGKVTRNDGVDLNRNFDEHFRYDEEGSSSLLASDTYRWPGPASEPETQAMQGLVDRIAPKFVSNWHSFGRWILYPQGWQIGTPIADNPIYTALAGTDADPAIPGSTPASAPTSCT